VWLVGAAVCFQSPTAADRHANASIASFDQQINRAAQAEQITLAPSRGAKTPS
jgi:hypothetical protein